MFAGIIYKLLGCAAVDRQRWFVMFWPKCKETGSMQLSGESGAN
jgi:hypothetical protein